MNRKIWIGLLMVAVSYGQLLVPKDWATANHFAAGFILSPGVFLFALGIIFLGEGISQRFGGVSLLGLARGGGAWKVVRFLAVAAVTGLLIEIFAQWLGKLWYYAYYPTWFYWPALVTSFIFYWVMIVESYMAVKAVLDKYIKFGGKQESGPLSYYSLEHTLYVLMGAVGAGILLFGLINVFFGYQLRGGYVFDALQPTFYAPPLRYILACFGGVWFIGEAMLYMRGLPSLTRSLLHGYIVPVLSLAGASLLVSVVWESQNAQVGYWVYTHWPYPGATLFHVQLSVLATWPANYIVYLIVPAAMVASWAPAFWSRPQRQKAKVQK